MLMFRIFSKRHKSSLPNKVVDGVKVIAAVTTPDLNCG